MRHKLDDIYQLSDFNNRKRETYYEYCEVLDKLFQPLTFLDLGCAQGYTIDYFVRSVGSIGIEGSTVALRLATPFAAKHIQQYDLRDKLDLSRTFDLVNCTEVMEHLEPEFEDILLDTIIRHMSNWLIFTAASVWDKARGTSHQSHWNVKPYSYWVGMFESRGLKIRADMRNKMREMLRTKKNVYPWWGRDLIVCQV